MDHCERAAALDCIRFTRDVAKFGLPSDHPIRGRARRIIERLEHSRDILREPIPSPTDRDRVLWSHRILGLLLDDWPPETEIDCRRKATVHAVIAALEFAIR